MEFVPFNELWRKLGVCARGELRQTIVGLSMFTEDNYCMESLLNKKTTGRLIK